MIDLDKLKSIDLKDLDVQKIVKILTQYQVPVIKAVLIIGSLLVAGMMFNGYRVQVQGLKNKMTLAESKLEVIKSRATAMQDLSDFQASFPQKINELQLITLISNYAKLNNITFISISPAQSKDMGLYDVISVSFNAASDNFKELMLFLRKIERSHYPLKIDSWSGTKADNGGINFTISISTIVIHTS